MNGRRHDEIQRERHGIVERCCATCNWWKPVSAYGCRAGKGWNARCRDCERERSTRRRVTKGIVPRAPTKGASGCLLQQLWRGVPQD